MRSTCFWCWCDCLYIYMCVWAWLWGPKVSIPKLMEAKGFVEAVRWKEHSERPRHIKYIEIDPFHLWSCRNPIQIPAPTLREYPKGLGKSLVKIYRELNISEKPLACLRQKADFSYSSDLQLFMDMPMGDTWPDACLKEVYLYLWNSKSTHIPKEWASTLVSFTRSLREATCQQYGLAPRNLCKRVGVELKYYKSLSQRMNLQYIPSTYRILEHPIQPWVVALCCYDLFAPLKLR